MAELGRMATVRLSCRTCPLQPITTDPPALEVTARSPCLACGTTSALESDGITFVAEPRKSTTTSLHHTPEPTALSAEIEKLPDLSGYVKLASRPEWVKVRIG